MNTINKNNKGEKPTLVFVSTLFVHAVDLFQKLTFALSTEFNYVLIDPFDFPDAFNSRKVVRISDVIQEASIKTKTILEGLQSDKTRRNKEIIIIGQGFGGLIAKILAEGNHLVRGVIGLASFPTNRIHFSFNALFGFLRLKNLLAPLHGSISLSSSQILSISRQNILLPCEQSLIIHGQTCVPSSVLFQLFLSQYGFYKVQVFPELVRCHVTEVSSNNDMVVPERATKKLVEFYDAHGCPIDEIILKDGGHVLTLGPCAEAVICEIRSFVKKYCNGHISVSGKKTK